MNYEKFTQKSIEAINSAQSIATEFGSPALMPIHLNFALLKDKDGLIPKILEYMGVNKDLFTKDIEREIEKLPKQQGGSIYPNDDFRKVLERAVKHQEDFKDEYTSVEHLYMAILEQKYSKSAPVFQKYKVDLMGVLQALKKITAIVKLHRTIRKTPMTYL